MKLTVAITSLFLLQLSAFALPFADESICPGEAEIISETYIGKDHNVKMTTLSCSEKIQPRILGTLVGRQGTTPPPPPLNVCGAKCNTNCFLPAGGGPDPNDCHVIADALRYDSQNVGAIFAIPNGNSTTNPVVMQFSSCKTFFVNQDLGPLAYCRTDWAALIDFVAPNCQATQNAHGGNCVAADQRWFVQVQHV
ncbi:hypothetical protein GALMADRAFT_725422 [Galerina marginata CBS 339.88]|uniref:Uncharacterized protein n=1 Tax=Galerina marginata (strain CBS 339.88) TaxID=685588 RepID=A0A067SZW0_GALM3|nr:hypothetical protein GALMADRAFT_725422 [Galerina marginata CBS 339.88]